MSTPRKMRAPEPVEGNMTPMIDCVFLLLVFFMCAAKFKTLDEKLVTRLPKNLGPHDVAKMEVQPRIIGLRVEEYSEVFDNRLGRCRPVASTIGVYYGDEFLGPYRVPSLAKDSESREQLTIGRDAVMLQLQEKLKLMKVSGGDAENTPTIVKPENRVPMDEVVAVLDTFAGLKLEHASFSGYDSTLEIVRREDGYSE